MRRELQEVKERAAAITASSGGDVDEYEALKEVPAPPIWSIPSHFLVLIVDPQCSACIVHCQCSMRAHLLQKATSGINSLK